MVSLELTEERFELVTNLITFGYYHVVLWLASL